MQDDSSEFVQNISNNTQERREIYRSSYFVVSKIRMFNQWRIEKKLTQAYEFQPIQRNSLEREFENGYQLDHPNIVRYLELQKTEQGVPYIIMEFVDGKNLQEYMNCNETFSTNEFSRIFKDLLSALAYLQQKQIYHLDIKPENILITHKEHIPKLIDFGLSSNDTYQTTLGSTKQYSTKEHLEYNKISSKTDMYSFAKTMAKFANRKHIRLNWRQKKIIRFCLQENPEKRLGATEAWNVLQRKSRSIFIAMFCALFFILTIIFATNKKKQDDTIIHKDTIELNNNVQVLESDVQEQEVEVQEQESGVQERKNDVQVVAVETTDEINKQQQSEYQRHIDSIAHELLTKVVNFDKNEFLRDSLFIVTLAKQKLETFENKLSIESEHKSRNLNILKSQLLHEIEQSSDSIVHLYMDKGQFEMANALARVEYFFMEEMGIMMDSLKNPSDKSLDVRRKLLEK